MSPQPTRSKLAQATGPILWLLHLMMSPVALALQLPLTILQRLGRPHAYDGLDVRAVSRTDGQFFLTRDSGETVAVRPGCCQLAMVDLGNGRQLLILWAKPVTTRVFYNRIPLALFDEPPAPADPILNDWESFFGQQVMKHLFPIGHLSP